jgi:hypothetical protein
MWVHTLVVKVCNKYSHRSKAWWPMECEGNTFSHLSTSPPINSLKLSIFSFDFEILLYHSSRSLLTPFFPFPRSINYDFASRCNKSFIPSLSIWFWLKIWFFLLLEIMALRTVTSYGPQAAQANEESPLDSSLQLTTMQHPCDEEPEPREVCAYLEGEPLWAWYYRIFPNSRTLVILLQVNPASGDKPKIICEGCYKIEDTFIFAWSLILGIGHYHWLCGPIRRLPPNSKADYFVRTIQHILNFL